MFFKQYGRYKKVLEEIYYLDSVEHNFDNSWYQILHFSMNHRTFFVHDAYNKIYKTTSPLIPSWANKNGQSKDIDPWHFNKSPVDTSFFKHSTAGETLAKYPTLGVERGDYILSTLIWYNA